MIKCIKETDVILNFMEDAKTSFVKDTTVSFEFPAGSWQGSKSRSIADIHGHDIPGIEAKSTFLDAKKDYLDAAKNSGIEHYIYSHDSFEEEQRSFWKDNGVSACVFLLTSDKWKILNDESGLFFDILSKDKLEQWAK